MLALEALLAVITREEGCDPGADACPAYLRPQTAMHNAATSLVRLCSHPETSRPDVPREHGVALPEGGNLRSLVEVAAHENWPALNVLPFECYPRNLHVGIY